MNHDPRETTLDPEGPAEWSRFRALAHRMVDEMIDHLSTLREQPAWRPMPDQVREAFTDGVPYRGEGADAAYSAFRRLILPYPNGNLHPRYWGWVQGNGTPLGMMADMLAAGLNPHLAGFNQAPALVEHQVIAWLAGLMGFPRDASGVLVTGGSMANVLGLTVARFAALKAAGHDVREHGLQPGPGAKRPPRLICYGSTETHGWARKGVELLGLGNAAFRRLPVDSDYRLDIGALRKAVAEDRAAGALPGCVIATAATVNTGAIDDLTAVADFCEAEHIWFHVDGAFGALARLSGELRERVAGIERADSLAFDLHKWGYLPFECACVLVRNAELHRATFAAGASYLEKTSRGVIAGGLPFADRGVDLTRGFKALKVWMSFKAHGVEAFARLIEQNVRQAEYLAELVEAHPDLELLAPVSLNVVCFRYAPRGIPPARLNALNQELLIRLQEAGIAVPSGTVLRERYALRCANVNHRSRREDFETLVDAVVRIGKEVLGDGVSAEQPLGDGVGVAEAVQQDGH
ncbi:MAG TPA: pyridoxal-dependent decarboxylase [Gemmatimonadales bacterium]|nr:pyridoxal-dependent decarboxylase [Gemmatimonadales bacterium]